MRLVLVTGLSGAGKSHALRIMEDLGFFCVDNLPPRMIGTLVELCARQDTERVAIGADIRGGAFFGDIYKAMDNLTAAGTTFEMLFLDSDDEMLVKRYKESRRSHPLAGEFATLPEAIGEERKQLGQLRQRADFVIDTSQILPKQLRERLTDVFAPAEAADFHISLMSFGYKRGLPSEADMVVDVRFIPNPFYVEGMRHLTGQSEEVRRYVLDWEGTPHFLESWTNLLLYVIPLYKKEAKNELVVAIGCTGGMHRSVVLAEALQERLLKAGYRATVTHRDMAREQDRR